jgi:hypothetical protein
LCHFPFTTFLVLQQWQHPSNLSATIWYTNPSTAFLFSSLVVFLPFRPGFLFDHPFCFTYSLVLSHYFIFLSFLLSSFKSCDLETAAAIFKYHSIHYATKAIMHAHFGSVEKDLNYRIFPIYCTSLPCATAATTKRRRSAENDMLE